MGIAGGIALGTFVASSAYSAHQSRKARKAAEREAGAAEEAAVAEREQVEAVQREIAADEAKRAMPTADDEAGRKARKRSIAAQMRRRGRRGTILTGDGGGTDTLGV